MGDRGAQRPETSNGSKQLFAWLVGGLWLITMGLAGAWGNAVIKRQDETNAIMLLRGERLARVEAKIEIIERDSADIKRIVMERVDVKISKVEKDVADVQRSFESMKQQRQ
jgi:hypothetical protein